MKAKHCITGFLLITLLMTMTIIGKAQEATLENPYLVDWAESFTEYHLALMSGDEQVILDDVLTFTGKITYDPKETRVGYTGKEVADGGLYSGKKTYMLGAGAGTEDEDLWYVSFTYESNADEKVMIYNTYFMLWACDELFGTFEENELSEEELDELITSLVGELLGADENEAIEIDNIVLVTKLLPSGQRLITLDTLDFYNEFYKGSISNYIQVM